MTRLETRRRMTLAVGGSLLLHGTFIVVASQLPAPRYAPDETFIVSLDLPKAPHPKQPPQPRIARLNLAPAHLKPRSRDLNWPFPYLNRSSRDLNRSAADLNRSSPDLNRSSHDLNKSSSDLNRSAADLNRSSFDLNKSSHHHGEDVALLHDNNGTPRGGRPARSRKSAPLQLTLGTGADDFHLSTDQSPPSPTRPGSATAERSHSSAAGGEQDSAPFTSGHGPLLAQVERGEAKPKHEEDTSDAAPENPNAPMTSAPHRTRRQRADDERESAAPSPTATPLAKPVEVREKPEMKTPEVFQRAVARSKPLPEYPASARQAHQTGDTTLRLSLDADGNVSDAEVTAGSGSATLDEAALRAVRRWKYEPARRGDTPVASTVKAVIKWTLKD